MTEEQRLSILKSNYFPYEKMTEQERDMCLEYLSKCKEFSDSHVIKNAYKYIIVNANFIKDETGYHYSGTYSINLENGHENRCFRGTIKFLEDTIEVNNEITRLCVNANLKVYNTIDIFTKIKDNLYERKSKYDYSDAIFKDQVKLNEYNQSKFLNTNGNKSL